MSPLSRAVAAAWLLLPATAAAAAVLHIDEEKSIFVAVGLRVSAGAAGSAAQTSYDVALDAAILSLGGQFNRTLKLSLNGGRAPNGTLNILDAIGMWEPLDFFKVWVGRFLVPTDRATLTGPFFSTSWDAPVVAAYPAAVVGRSEGLAIWGNIAPARLKYYAGVFRRPDILPTQWSDLMGTVRLAFTPIGSEPTYYANGSFFGARNVLTFAAGARVAPNMVGPADARGDLFGWNLDVFFEHSLGAAGVLTVEAALFRYYPSLTPSATVPGGTATSASVAWIPPVQLGSGRFQLALRHQHLFSGRGDSFDGTLNYLVNGHFMRIALTGFAALPSNPAAPATWGARLGAQLIL